MKPQEIFDTVAKHLIQQGEMAQDSRGCRYRQERDDGPTLKCAVGCLIRDEDYTDRMEGWDVNGLLDRFGGVLPSWMVDHRSLLLNLQAAHDAPSTWDHPNNLRKALFQVSRDHGLSPAVLHA